MNFGGAVVNVVDAVVQIVYLSSAAQLLCYCLRDKSCVMLYYIGLYRVSVKRRFLYYREIAKSHHGEVEGARDGCRRYREYINIRELLFQFFFLCDAEALFFVHYQQSEIFKPNIV